MGILKGNTVYSGDNTPVNAKYLDYNGTYVYGPDGTGYIVGADFDFNQFVYRYRTLAAPILASYEAALNPNSLSAAFESYQLAVCNILLHNFPAGAPDDLQRTYNGSSYHSWRGFVKDFTPVASFVYGVACAILEVPLYECEAAGGAVNIKARYTPRKNDPTIGDYISLAWAGGNSDINISGFLGNNPHNPPNIERGYRFVNDYALNNVTVSQ